MSKKLVLCFDGTWNAMIDNPGEETDTNTNVAKMYSSITQSDEQLVMYDSGVGSQWYDRVVGGGIGLGIETNIKQGYAWLADNYEAGDDIYLFGFSRGAYTARSLAGLLFRCGLLPKDNASRINIELAYQKYENHTIGKLADWFLSSKASIVPIKFVGVWDTVGALGLPIELLGVSDQLYAYHDVDFHENVQNAYHAVAVDEHRSIFNVTLWDPPSQTLANIEQRWFIGAHADVGGGYTDLRQWPRHTLRWMQEKAQACGLELTLVEPPVLDYAVGVHDSYSEFLKGKFSLKYDRLYRKFGETQFGNEVLDDSVKEKMRLDDSYRPGNEGL